MLSLGGSAMIEDWQQRMVTWMAHEKAQDMRLEDALALKFEHRPPSVFKYRKVDDYSLQNLETDFVWVCSPTDYNDPYDSSLSIASNELSSFILQQGIQELLKQGLSEDLAPERFQKLLTATNPAVALQEALLGQDEIPEELWPSLIAAFEEQIQRWKTTMEQSLPSSHKASLKICSFSATAESIIMWSHYADQHRGFCVEYDLETLPPTHLFPRMLYPVLYSEKLFDATPYYLAMLQDRKEFNILFPALAALYKSPAWSYEQEWRLVIPANMVKEATRWRVPKPKRLYLGSRMTTEQKNDVLAIARKRDIQVYQTYLAEDSFCLKSTPVENPGPIVPEASPIDVG
jgi:hypothetical protein